MVSFTNIIAGEFRGKKLLLPPHDITRATKSILKESFFNAISDKIYNCTFVEIFGGSGSMAIEALSRGAKKAYAIEQNKIAFEVLKQNTNFLKHKCFIFHDNTFSSSHLYKNEKNLILYFDPPFDYRNPQYHAHDKSINLMQNLSTHDIKQVGFEHFSKQQMPSIIGNFKLKKTKKFGKSSISYYEL